MDWGLDQFLQPSSPLLLLIITTTFISLLKLISSIINTNLLIFQAKKLGFNSAELDKLEEKAMRRHRREYPKGGGGGVKKNIGLCFTFSSFFFGPFYLSINFPIYPQKPSWALFCCFNPRVLSANRVDFGPFLFDKFSNLPPSPDPHDERQYNENQSSVHSSVSVPSSLSSYSSDGAEE